MTTAKPNESGSESCKAMSARAERLEQMRALYTRGKQLVHADQDAHIEIYREELAAGRVILLAFSGKRSKPDFHYSFRSLDAAQRHQDEYLKRVAITFAYKQRQAAERAAKRAQGHQLKPGDILVACWGYEQTNIDYYEVIRLVGRASVQVRKIGKQSVDTNYLQGDCVPDRGNYIGEPMTKRVTASGNSVRIDDVHYAIKEEPIIVGGIECFPARSWSAYA